MNPYVAYMKRAADDRSAHETLRDGVLWGLLMRSGKGLSPVGAVLNATADAALYQPLLEGSPVRPVPPDRRGGPTSSL